MVWFKVDDKLHTHHKTRKAGKTAMGVWVLAGSWASDTGTDGFIPAECLPPGATKADARRLVEAGLFTPGVRDGEAGWWMHDFLDYNPSAEEVEKDRAKARTRMSRLRSGERSPEQPVNVPRTFTTPSPVPSRPEPLVRSISPSEPHARTAIDRLTDEDLQALASRLAASTSWARTVAVQVLARAKATVANPRGYVLAAIDDNPAAYRPTPGPLKATEHCPTHPGKWASNCGGCAADAKAAR